MYLFALKNDSNNPFYAVCANLSLTDNFFAIRKSICISITEVLDKQLRVKISDKNFEWRFDESFITFKFIKSKSQVLVSSLNTKNVCKNLVASNYKH